MSGDHSSRHPAGCECTRCRGFQPGNTAALTHGSTSERRVKPLATVQKRRFLRQNNLRKSDLDGIGLALLDTYSRAASKVELLDLYFAERGLLEEDGKPQPALAVYFVALNSATRSLKALREHLRQRAEVDPFETLAVIEAEGREIMRRRALREAGGDG